MGSSSSMPTFRPLRQHWAIFQCCCAVVSKWKLEPIDHALPQRHSLGRIQHGRLGLVCMTRSAAPSAGRKKNARGLQRKLGRYFKLALQPACILFLQPACCRASHNETPPTVIQSGHGRLTELLNDSNDDYDITETVGRSCSERRRSKRT